MSTKKIDNVDEDKKGRRSLRLRNLSSDSDTSTKTIGSPKRMVITRNQLSTIKEKGTNTQSMQQKSINSPYKTRRNANTIDNVDVDLEQIINLPRASLRKKRASSELNTHDFSKLNLDTNLKSYSVSPPRTMPLSVLKLQTKFVNNKQKSNTTVESVINISDTDEENDLNETDEVTIKPELPKYLTLNNESNSSNSNNFESYINDEEIPSEATDYKRLMKVSNNNNDNDSNQSNEENSVESDMSINKTSKNTIEDIQIENSLIQNKRLKTEPDSKSNNVHDNIRNESNEEVISLHDDNEMDSDTVINISKNSSNISTIEDIQIENSLIQNKRLNRESDSKSHNIEHNKMNESVEEVISLQDDSKSINIEDNKIYESDEEVISLQDDNEMESDAVIDISKTTSNNSIIEDIQIENSLIQNKRFKTKSDNTINNIEDDKMNESNKEVILLQDDSKSINIEDNKIYESDEEVISLQDDNEMDSDTVIDISKTTSNNSIIEDIQIENSLIQNKRFKTKSDNKINNIEDDKMNESNKEVILLHYDNEMYPDTVINKSENSSNIPTTDDIHIENSLIQNKRLNTDSDGVNNNIEDNKMNQSNEEGILLHEDNGMESDTSINKSKNSCNIATIEDIHIEDNLIDNKRLNTESDGESNNIEDNKNNQLNEDIISLHQNTSINENKNSSNISNAIEDSLIENKRLNTQSNNKNNNIEHNKINKSNEEVISLVEENIIEVDMSVNKCKNSICDKIKDNLDVSDNKMSSNKSKNSTDEDNDVKIVDNNLSNETSSIVNDSANNCETISATVENKEIVSIKKKLSEKPKFQKVSVSIDFETVIRDSDNDLKSSKSLKTEGLDEDNDVKIVDNNLSNETSSIVNDSANNCETISATVDNNAIVSINKKLPITPKYQKVSVLINYEALVNQNDFDPKSSKSLKTEDLVSKRNIQDTINTSITKALNSIEEGLNNKAQILYEKLLESPELNDNKKRLNCSTPYPISLLKRDDKKNTPNNKKRLNSSTPYPISLLKRDDNNNTPDNNKKRLNRSTPYPISIKRKCSSKLENKLNDIECKVEMVNTNRVKDNITQKAIEDKDSLIDTSLQSESNVTSEEIKNVDKNYNNFYMDVEGANEVNDKNDTNDANHDNSDNNSIGDNTDVEDDANNDNKTKPNVYSSNIKDRKSISLSLESYEKAQENDNNDKENEITITGDDENIIDTKWKPSFLSLSLPFSNVSPKKPTDLSNFSYKFSSKLESDTENVDDNIEKDVSENGTKKFEEKKGISIDSVLDRCNSYLAKVNEEKHMARLASRKEKHENQDRIRHKKELKLLKRANKLAAARKLHSEKLEKMEKKKLKKERKLFEKNLMENNNLLSSNASEYSSVTPNENENVTIVKLTKEERQTKASENVENDGYDEDCKLVPQIKKALLNSLRLLIDSRKMDNEQKNTIKELQNTKTKNANQNKIKDPEIVEALKLYDIAKKYAIKKPIVKKSNKGDIKNTQISELPLSKPLTPIVNSSGKFLVSSEPVNYRHQFEGSTAGSTGNFTVTVMPHDPTLHKPAIDDLYHIKYASLRKSMFNKNIKRITSQELILSKEKQRKFK